MEKYNMTVRQAQDTKNDCNLIFSLSNDPLVRANSFNTKPIEYVAHCQFRGKHIACDFIKLGIEELKKNWHNVETVVAEVKDENAASNKLFLRERFELIYRVKIDNMLQYQGGKVV